MPTSKIKSSPPTLKNATGIPVATGAVIGLAIFILLPVAQWVDAMASRHDVKIDLANDPPPPPPIITQQREEPEQEQKEIEELQEQPPPPSLDMLELALNADMSSLVEGGVAMPSFNVGGDLSEMIFDIRDLDQIPRPISRQSPQYPVDLRRAGISGNVVIEMIVDANGNVRNPIVKESTNVGFNDAALRAVRSWRFEPGMKNGKKVSTRVQQPIPFNVN